MRPETTLDSISFVLLLIGAFAWAFVADFNVLDVALEAIWDPLDDVVFILIVLAGVYRLVRALQPRR
jgi:uncharacterized membrane protein YuzA (DUF378 family)